VLVRTAVRDDLPEIERITVQACAEAFAGILPPQVAEAERTRVAPGSALRAALLAGDLLVGTGADGRIDAIAMLSLEDDVVEMRTMLASGHPSREPSVTDFVAAVRRRGWAGPITSEAVLGNEPHESFLESGGFSPGEVVAQDIEGHVLFRRRWWLPAQVERLHGTG